MFATESTSFRKLTNSASTVMKKRKVISAFGNGEKCLCFEFRVFQDTLLPVQEQKRAPIESILKMSYNFVCKA